MNSATEVTEHVTVSNTDANNNKSDEKSTEIGPSKISKSLTQLRLPDLGSIFHGIRSKTKQSTSLVKSGGERSNHTNCPLELLADKDGPDSDKADSCHIDVDLCRSRVCTKKGLTSNLRNHFGGIFKIRRDLAKKGTSSEVQMQHCEEVEARHSNCRELPPTPKSESDMSSISSTDESSSESTNEESESDSDEEQSPHASTSMLEGKEAGFLTNIEKVKDCYWYWGPLSSEDADKLLKEEPTGSFLLRDSSDECHIFTLSFKMDDSVCHVRIEHSRGTFSFGSSTRFKYPTIVDFIENAVKHSHSGRYLFFLNREPTYGPLRVQLLHPVSRSKKVQSLQHMCRFAILKMVRKDLVPSLPLPPPLIEYLNEAQIYLEKNN